jgi:hypothetical protein
MAALGIQQWASQSIMRQGCDSIPINPELVVAANQHAQAALARLKMVVQEDQWRETLTIELGAASARLPAWIDEHRHQNGMHDSGLDPGEFCNPDRLSGSRDHCGAVPAVNHVAIVINHVQSWIVFPFASKLLIDGTS